MHQPAADPFGAPLPVFARQALDQGDGVGGQTACGLPTVRLDPPEQAQAGAVPAQPGLGLDDPQDGLPVRDETREAHRDNRSRQVRRRVFSWRCRTINCSRRRACSTCTSERRHGRSASGPVTRLGLAGGVRWRKTWRAALERRAHSRLANRVSWRNSLVTILRRVVVRGGRVEHGRVTRDPLAAETQPGEPSRQRGRRHVHRITKEENRTPVAHYGVTQGAWDHQFSAGIGSDKPCGQHRGAAFDVGEAKGDGASGQVIRRVTCRNAHDRRPVALGRFTVPILSRAARSPTGGEDHGTPPVGRP